MSTTSIIPLSEITLDFVRSSGAGGQNVNKLATKVFVRWNVAASRSFTPEQKQRLLEHLRNRLTSSGEIIISNETSRSQLQNRLSAIARLNALVKAALTIPKQRRPTRPTKASKIRRLESKQRVSASKKLRRMIE
jgi:ribosome-associated protein